MDKRSCRDRQTRLRRQLLRSASVIAIAVALGHAPAAKAQLAALRSAVSAGNAATAQRFPGGVVPNRPGKGQLNQSNSAHMQGAQMRALQYQTRFTQALSMAKDAQEAARAAAAALQPDVPDGLQPGGLVPVQDPVKSAEDTTGLHTWEGAEQPVEEREENGEVKVTVKQTQARAILSWETFNVGQKTDLTFDQSQDGVAQSSWVVLNRVVGQLDPTTGLRDPNATPAPSRILGSIHAPGTVLIMNQNGVIFSGTSQINTNSLIATSLEIGRALDIPTGTRLNIAQRNQEFLNFGFLGFADQAPAGELNFAYTFSAQENLTNDGLDPMLEGSIEVQAGAQITSGVGGYVLLTGPKVVNAGTITSPAGEVALQSGRNIKMTRSTGAADDNPDVRGFTLTSTDGTNPTDHDYVLNTGIIDVPQGYLSLGATDFGAVMQQGVLASTTSVSRNGFIQLSGGDIQIGEGSTMGVTPDDGDATIPQDPESIGDFRVSKITIGSETSRIEIGKDSMLYAPGADVEIGVPPGQDSASDKDAPGASRIFIDTGAIIDVAGLTDVLIPASRNAILIDPVKGNELRDDPNYRDSFLNGAMVLVDPRLSGVDENGVAWVGSPLIDAKSFAEQVGVKVEELMTKGGNVSLGVRSHSSSLDQNLASDITVKSGAVIDVSGGWVTYEGGVVRTTQLITIDGNIIDIGHADIMGGYVGINSGFTREQPRWGVSETWASPLLQGAHYEPTYSEGRDAGSLTLKGSSIVLDGTMYGEAYAGPRQLADAHMGTASSSVFGDFRRMQGAPSQMPSSGFLFIQGLSGDTDKTIIQGAGDIQIVSQANYHAVDSALGYGQSVALDANGNLVVPVERDPNSYLPADREQVISISADALSSFGLSALSLETSGKISVAADANVTLQAGGIFNAVAGRAITVDGSINVASGLIQMQTINAGQGSVFVQEDEAPGAFDITVNGTLSTRGRWVNDDGADSDHLMGSAYTDGGSVVLIGAPRQTLYTQLEHEGEDLPDTNVDISGSILLNDTSVIDVSGGGYVDTKGNLSLSARGGNVSLIEETTYFQLAQDVSDNPGGIPGFRITGYDLTGTDVFPVNPDEITARVTLDGTILAAGFGGGGTFTLVTPEIQFGGEATDGAGTQLGLDFFSTSGFGNFDITSYKTELDQNNFDNGLGGYNAILATQTLTIGDGQVLNLTQSMFSNVLDPDQMQVLRDLESGGDLYSVMTPGVPADAWDARSVNLTLGGLIELDVASGGKIVGAAGSTITAGKILNEGNIRIAGGTLTQSEALPTLYAEGATALGVHDLSEIFSVNADGTIHEDDPNAKGLTDGAGNVLTNRQVAAQFGIYKLGRLEADQGVVLAAGSVTDLSGTAIVNPRATSAVDGFQDGRLVGGGTLQTAAALHTTDLTFRTPIGVSTYYNLENPKLVILPETLVAQAGSLLDISGVATDAFYRMGSSGRPEQTELWSSGGTLAMNNGGSLTGATIKAEGGAEHAMGGTLVILDPTLVQSADEEQTGKNIVAADQIAQSGFDTFVAEGSLNTAGDVRLALDRAFFLVSRPYDGQANLQDPAARDAFAPVVHLGGDLEIDAPYIRFSSSLQSVSTPFVGDPGDHAATFHAGEIDISGAVLFDQSVADLKLIADNDMRLSGVAPWQRAFNQDPESVDPSLVGQLAVNGDLEITAGQVFPTTGSTFYITSAAEGGTITFARSEGETPATPYSAGGDLTVQAANIVQGGVIRVPIGHLQLGSNDAFEIENGGIAVQFAPATESLEVLDGSITSVSADGMVIPYGTTTDQIEWFFAATGADELAAPPQAVLDMAGTNVKIDEGATVDLTGGGDLYAYEFISGVGGSHDVLDRFNDDPFSGNDGCQYPDCRQVYAIVPGLSDPAQAGQAALYDPIYSAQYGDLYSAQAAGKQVYLDHVPGLAPGWYTLLPAKYATLPGGIRVVESDGRVIPGTYQRQRDGSYIVNGYYGMAGTNLYDSDLRSFNIQTQRVFDRYSNIALTSATEKFARDAAHDGNDAPPLPIDSGRLVLAPEETLEIDAELEADPAKGGRGAEVDISGDSFAIVSDLGSAGNPDGTILLSADQLTNLHAASLLIGGERTDNADGTTSLEVTAKSITVANDSGHALVAPEIVLAVDGEGSGITVEDGAAIRSEGTLTRARTGDYVIDGGSDTMTGQGAVLRVAEGPQRLVTRKNVEDVATGFLDVGAADLEGATVLLDSSGDLTASPDLRLKTDALALGAGQVTFTGDPTGLSGLVITPELQALIAGIGELTIRTPGAIDFSAGTYSFNDLTLDTPGLELKDGSGVVINADKLTLANSGTELAACDSEGGIACGGGALAINAAEIAFASGTVRTFGFGGTVTLAATAGIFAQGDSIFDAGPAALVIETPFIGDRVFPLAPGETQEIASLSLVTTGAVEISNPGDAAAGDFDGSPGATIAISGNSVDITGTTIRATAGTLDIKSNTSLTVGGGAVLATPGYEKNFGDAADPYIVSAPGGLVHLTALDGDIDLREGSLVSVGGGAGTAGTVEFSAAQGNVIFDGTLDAEARNGGGSFVLDQQGAFDLSSFDTRFGDQFDGTVAIRTATGDLVLDGDAKLSAQNVMLTADGGSIDIFGLIDVSGVFGGNVNLFGLDGVTLHAGSKIDAHAEGYGARDTRQASGGNVQVGTDGDGVITFEDGAVIDVSARHGDRMVPIVHNGKTYYIYVPADLGGTVEFRAPIIEDGEGRTVNVFYDGGADGIVGARDVAVQAFERFDLQEIASDPNFVGVTINEDGQAVLDLGADGGVNWLADMAPGTLVDFIQNFALDGDTSRLGALEEMDSFHARPGMELDYDGDIVLASNWNLGAGIVDTERALADGLMFQVPGSDKLYITAGKEQEIFSNYTTMLYRTGGSVDGEAGVLTIRAQGDLDLKGSISDGFFQFHDQTDPDYLSRQLGGGNKEYEAYLESGCQGDCNMIGAWRTVSGPDDLPDNYIFINVPGANDLQSFLFNPAPYSAEANAADAKGSIGNGDGDPLGSMQLFPLIKHTADGPSAVAASFTYQLVSGADIMSVDPMRTQPGSTANLIVEGEGTYAYEGDKINNTSQYADQLFMLVGKDFVTPEDWYNAIIGSTGASADAFTFIDFGSAPGGFKDFLLSQIPVYFAEHPDEFQIISKNDRINGVTTRLELAAGYLTDVIARNFSAFKSQYKTPKPKVYDETIAHTRTLVRTGTGDIVMAAAGNIDLTNGDPVYRTLKGKDTDFEDGLQVGGTVVYTAGHSVDPGPFTITDELTGLDFEIDPTQFDTRGDFIGNPPEYRYGAGGDASVQGTGLAGVLISDPVFADGGGDVTMVAGGDVKGRRDEWQEVRIRQNYDAFKDAFYLWMGPPDQPWRSGAIGNASVALINPQLFQEGVGALGGGTVRISAGRDVSDITIADDTSIVTGNVRQGGFNATLALMSFGGGNVFVDAGRDILGGRFDIASGLAAIAAGRDIAGTGLIKVADKDDPSAFQENTMRLRLSDAFVSLTARGDIELQGITALGIAGASDEVDANMNAHGFYSETAGVSLLADGSVGIENRGADVQTEGNGATGNTQTAVYPGTFEAVALTGDLGIATGAGIARSVFTMPAPEGELVLVSGGNILPLTIAQDDGDRGLLPGIFTIFDASTELVISGRPFLFPGVLPDMTTVERQTLHNANATHAGDLAPNRIYSGGDIVDMILSVAKQTRIGAARDIVNMMFFGQNLAQADVTRIVAGRDITATTKLVEPVIDAQGDVGDPEAAVQGNTFVVGGPGSFFLEAGRDAGPFLNSAVTDGIATSINGNVKTGRLVFAGGVQSVGNEWNPWLQAQGADLFVEFGVGKGQSFDALRDYYLNPANLGNLDGDLFEQVKDGDGNLVPNRNKPIYAPVLIKWLQQHQEALLEQLYGTTDIDFQQAYDAFKTLPELTQRVFLLGSVYFNELVQTSVPDGPSFKQYSRGYQAVNLLFPSELGYTRNDLSGGSNGANETVETGNLDLRLATIQTSRGGNIYLVGPGGRVLAGSTVRTSEQAARRTYDGGRLFLGNPFFAPQPAQIVQIPIGFEGILTLRGGSIYTFTDLDFLLNQSRLFTEQGGDIAMWSSNGDLNAGQGPKTSANFPPVVVKVDQDLVSEVDSAGGVSGAGIAAFEPAPGVEAPDVFLIAPRGTVDAGDAGVRVAGNLFIAAQTVANAENFNVGGTSSGIPNEGAVDVAAQTAGNNAAAAAEQQADNLASSRALATPASIVTVEILGISGDEGNTEDEEERKKKKKSS